MNLEEKYPFIASWVADGQIQIGQGDSSYSYAPLAAVIDAGGVGRGGGETAVVFVNLDEILPTIDPNLP